MGDWPGLWGERSVALDAFWSPRESLSRQRVPGAPQQYSAWRVSGGKELPMFLTLPEMDVKPGPQRRLFSYHHLLVFVPV